MPVLRPSENAPSRPGDAAGVTASMMQNPMPSTCNNNRISGIAYTRLPLSPALSVGTSSTHAVPRSGT